MSAAGRSVPRLLRAFRSVCVPRAADSLMFLCFHFLQALSFLPVLLLLGAAAAGGTLLSAVTALLPAAAAGWAGMTLFAAVLARAGGLSVRCMAGGILLFPVFMASWVPLQIVSLVRRTRTWTEIRHGSCLPKVLPEPIRLPEPQAVRRIS